MSALKKAVSSIEIMWNVKNKRGPDIELEKYKNPAWEGEHFGNNKLEHKGKGISGPTEGVKENELNLVEEGRRGL